MGVEFATILAVPAIAKASVTATSCSNELSPAPPRADASTVAATSRHLTGVTRALCVTAGWWGRQIASIPRYRVKVSEKLRMTIAFDGPDEDGWIVAQVVEVPGAISQGRTREEARENVIDALRLMLSPDDGDASDESVALEVLLPA